MSGTVTSRRRDAPGVRRSGERRADRELRALEADVEHVRIRRSSATAAELSLETRAVISVIPAARASASNSAVRVDPMPSCGTRRPPRRRSRRCARRGRAVRARPAAGRPRGRPRARGASSPPRELLELGRAEARLRPVEACASRPLAEALEDRQDGAHVAVAKGRTRRVGPCFGLRNRVCTSQLPLGSCDDLRVSLVALMSLPTA